MTAGGLTILRPLKRAVMAKQYDVAPNGQVTQQAWPTVARYRVEQAEAADIHGLLRLLQKIERDQRACVIRGEPIAGLDLSNTARKKVENGGGFADVPRSWIMLDLDKVPLPPGSSVIDDPADAARFLIEMITAHAPELEGVTAIVQFSASAGIEELAETEAAAGLPPRWDGVVKRGAGVGAHAWYWLAEPVDGAALARWAGAINARVGHKVVDDATLRTVQPHYTAGPVFGPGLGDPLLGKRTLLVEGLADTATLIIPEIAARASYEPGSRSHITGGYRGALDAIGGPDGFNTPIMRAVASYIGSNWPAPDTETLIDDIAARVLAADPGSRSPAEIQRYADRGQIAARVKWALEREAANRAAKAEVSATAPAAAPIQPTYLDRGVSLVEAQHLAKKALVGLAARIAAGKVPQMLLRMTVGAGKTFIAIDMLPALLAAGRAVGRGPALFTHPRHVLGDQIAADIRARHPGLRVAVYRGMDAPDPSQPGKSMCQDPVLPRAARAAGQSATHGCQFCPLAPNCSYLGQAQAGHGADVWVAPHQVHFLMPFAGWPRVKVDDRRMPVQPSVIVVDEDVTGAGLDGLNLLDPKQMALSALASDETPNVHGLERERLLNLRRRGLAALEGQPAGGVFRELLLQAEMQEIAADGAPLNPAKEWAALEWATKPRIRLGKGATRADAMAAYETAAAQRFTPRLPMLAERIAAFLVTGDARSVNLTINPEAELGRGQGTGPAVQFAWRRDFHEAWQAPLLFLDATGRAEILRHWAPDLEMTDIEVMAPHQHVVQVSDREFGRSWAIQPGNVSRLADLVLVEVARATGPVLGVLQMAAERLLREEIEGRGGVRDLIPEGGDEDAPATYRFPSGAVLHLAHHGDITGSNAWQEVVTVIIVGRPATNRLAGERQAEVIAGRACDVVADGEDSWWPTAPAAMRMADSTGRAIEKQPRHPDPLVEAVRWSTTEGAVLQAGGRARGVRRGPEQPVRMVVLAALALPLTVAEAPTWDEIQPDRLTVAAAEAALMGRALPLAPADMAQARPDRWRTEIAAQHDLKRARKGGQTLIIDAHKGLAPLSGQKVARYRKAGGRGSLAMALVPLEEGEAALKAEVGLLSAYEVVVGEPAPMPQPANDPGAGDVADPPPSPPSVIALVPPPLTPAAQRGRLLELAQRLEAARPKQAWGIRAMDWRAHQVAAQAAAILPQDDWQAWRATSRAVWEGEAPMPAARMAG